MPIGVPTRMFIRNSHNLYGCLRRCLLGCPIAHRDADGCLQGSPADYGDLHIIMRMLIDYKDAYQTAYGNSYRDAYTNANRNADKGTLLRIRRLIGMSIRMRIAILYECLWGSPTANRNANRISYCL